MFSSSLVNHHGKGGGIQELRVRTHTAAALSTSLSSWELKGFVLLVPTHLVHWPRKKAKMNLDTTSLDYSPPGDAHKLGTRGPYDHHHNRLAKKKSKKSPRLIIVTNNLPLTFSCDHAAPSQRMKRCTCGDKAKDSSDFDSDDMELEEERPADSCGICYHKESKREGMGIGSSAHKRRVGAGKSYPRLNARSLTTFGGPSTLGHSEIPKQYEEPMSAVERAKRWRIEQSADHLLLKVTQLLKGSSPSLPLLRTRILREGVSNSFFFSVHTSFSS